MTQSRLLAKSWHRTNEPPPVSVFLPVHLAEACLAAEQVIIHTGSQQLSALGLDPALWGNRFRRTVLLAAALHDLGKANDHFQGMIRRTPDRRGKPQGLRHEWVTLLLLQQQGMREWLSPVLDEEEQDCCVVLWAITGHHPAYERPSPPRSAIDGSGAEMRLLVSHPDFVRCLKWLRVRFNLSQPPVFAADLVVPLCASADAFSEIYRVHRESLHTWETMGRNEKRFSAAVKCCTVAGDVAGSALPSKVSGGSDRRDWVGRAFARVPTRKQIEEVIRERLGTAASLRPFQRLVGESSSPVTFVKAGCGCGKTLAAYHWAASQHPGKRIYFCYPTTGTATEGFRDYLFDTDAGVSRFGAQLFHGRASVDLEMILHVERDDEPDPGSLADGLARIESLDAWSTPIVSCTVDTVLGLMQNNRRGLYAWPALAGAAFVFDEIHAYDDKLFGVLLRFLSELPGVPVLLMTASLPESRRQCLTACLQRRGVALHEVAGPEELERRERYHRYDVMGNENVLATVQREIEAGGKVLWVCNTVDRTIRVAEETIALQPVIYHSRFRYVDRVARHHDVIRAFRQDRAALAICTQVAEMSLDLSATLLVTDLAPVPSIIQRLGRLNRRAQDGDPTRPFLVIEPRDSGGSLMHWPYEPADLAACRAWLDDLPTGAISQADLAAAWERLEETRERRLPSSASCWLDGGPSTQVVELREASPGIAVVLDGDADHVRSGDRRLNEVMVPMPPPKTLKWRDWPRVKGMPIAPLEVIDYDERRGARWRKRDV